MRSIILLLAVLLGVWAPKSHAQAQPVNTGLGICIDFMIYASPKLTGQVNGTDFQFVYGPGAYLDRTGKKVYIQNYTCNTDNIDMPGLYFRVSQVAHEMGHLYRNPGFPLGTREQYIENSCTYEGEAVLNNGDARSEILDTSEGTADIGLAAANAPALLGLIAAGGPELAKRVGNAFCEANVTSTTGENYKVFYGNQYDTLYSQGEEG